MEPKALAAEMFGTFVLALSVLISINSPGFPIPTPVIAGLTLGLLVYTIGPVSDCHINPAVTSGLLSIGKIEPAAAGGYILAQFLGAAAALGLGALLFSTPVALDVGNSAHVGLSELLGASIFVFGIASVVIGRVPSAMAGIVIGGSLTLGISFAAHATNGVLGSQLARALSDTAAASPD